MQHNAAVTLMVTAGLFPFFLLFWVLVLSGCLLKAAGKRRLAPPALYTHLSITSWDTVRAVAIVLLQFCFLMSFSLTYSIPWSSDWMTWFSSLFLLDVARLADPSVVYHFFWAIVVIQLAAVLLYFVLKFLRSRREMRNPVSLLHEYPVKSRTLCRVRVAFVEITFVPFLKRSLEMLHCDLTLQIYPDSVSYLYENPAFACWEGHHVAVATVSILMCLGLILQAGWVASEKHPFEKCSYEPLWMVTYSMIRVPLVLLVMVTHSGHPIVGTLGSATVLVAMFVTHIISQPSHALPLVNSLRSATLASASWMGFCAFICSLLDDNDNNVPLILLLSGAPVMALVGWVFNRIYDRWRLYSKLRAIRDLFDESKVRLRGQPAVSVEQVAAVGALGVHSMAMDYQEEVAQCTLDCLTGHLARAPSPGNSRELLVHILQIVSNLAAFKRGRALLCSEEIVPSIAGLLAADNVPSAGRSLALSALLNIASGDRPDQCADIVASRCVADISMLALDMGQAEEEGAKDIGGEAWEDAREQCLQRQWLAGRLLFTLAKCSSQDVSRAMTDPWVVHRMLQLCSSTFPVVQLALAESLCALSARVEKKTLSTALAPEHLPRLRESTSLQVRHAAAVALELLAPSDAGDLPIMYSGNVAIDLKSPADTPPPKSAGGRSEVEDHIAWGRGTREMAAGRRERRVIKGRRRRRTPAARGPDASGVEEGRTSDEERRGGPTSPLNYSEDDEDEGEEGEEEEEAENVTKLQRERAAFEAEREKREQVEETTKWKHESMRREQQTGDLEAANADLRAALREEQEATKKVVERMERYKLDLDKMTHIVAEDEAQKMKVAEARQRFLAFTPVLGMQVASNTGMFSKQGVKVSQVQPGKPAHLAGLQLGDVISAVGGGPGVAIQSTQHFKQCMTTDYHPGDLIPLKVQRGVQGTELYVHLELGAVHHTQEKIREIRDLAGRFK